MSRLSSAGLEPRKSLSHFTLAAVQCMRRLYPEAYADKSFDNTGLLLEAPPVDAKRRQHSVLLTIDLTTAVTNEAIRRGDSLIVAYHPIIFRGLKSLTLCNSQQQSLLRLAQAGISVYSPHTAVDAAAGGLGDYLAEMLTNNPMGDTSDLQHTREIISPVVGMEGDKEIGMGRIVRLQEPQALNLFMERLKAGLKLSSHVPVAIPFHHRTMGDGRVPERVMIKSIGICAGSGGSLLRDVDVDLLVTGELSHHETLAALEEGKCVIAPFHSNTERQYLYDVMRPRLAEALEIEGRQTTGADLYQDGSVEVFVSEADRDPYDIYDVSQSRGA